MRRLGGGGGVVCMDVCLWVSVGGLCVSVWIGRWEMRICCFSIYHIVYKFGYWVNEYLCLSIYVC